MSVCEDQSKFNQAFEKAADNYLEKPVYANKTVAIVSVVIMLVFTVWALLLAMRVKEKEHRVLHLLLALIASPLYVISYYLSKIGDKSSKI